MRIVSAKAETFFSPIPMRFQTSNMDSTLYFAVCGGSRPLRTADLTSLWRSTENCAPAYYIPESALVLAIQAGGQESLCKHVIARNEITKQSHCISSRSIPSHRDCFIPCSARQLQRGLQSRDAARGCDEETRHHFFLLKEEPSRGIKKGFNQTPCPKGLDTRKETA